MLKVKYNILLSLLLFTSSLVYAQDGAYNQYTPYSVYGIGSIAKEGTAYNKSMGGTGLASRSRRFVNYTNPAAVTARDTLSFMMDMGVSLENKIFTQNGINSANNTFNISDIAISFPIYRKLAMVMGISPFSDLGYDFSFNVNDPEIIGNTGKIYYSSAGKGGTYQVFAGAGAELFKGFSIGAQAIYYFGSINKNSQMIFNDSSYRNFYSGYKLEIHALTGKFGVQYEFPIASDVKMTLAGTYRMNTNLKGSVTDFKYATMSSLTDTLRYDVVNLNEDSKVKIADEIGVGVSVRKGDKWTAEVNYLRSDWTKSNFDVVGFSNVGVSTFTSSFSESVRAGFEYVPNRNDIRYYMRRCAYRGGVYYDKSYCLVDNKAVRSYGLTLGITLPVYMLYNGITIGVDVGQTGNARGNMTRERYAKFVIGFNIHDLWFRKMQYE